MRSIKIVCTPLKNGKEKPRLFSLGNKNKEKMLGVLIALSIKQFSEREFDHKISTPPSYIVLSDCESEHEDK